jgi:hypothetical protein
MFIKSKETGRRIDSKVIEIKRNYKDMGKTNYNPKSKSNLKPIAKGEVRNPNGAPRKLPKLDVILANVLGEENKDGKTAAEQIIEAMRRKANAGDTKAAALLLDRGWGKIKESLDITTDGEKINKSAIQIEIITTKKDGEDKD